MKYFLSVPKKNFKASFEIANMIVEKKPHETAEMLIKPFIYEDKNIILGEKREKRLK